MSRDRRQKSETKSRRRPPFIGGLLRMTYQAARRRQLEALAERGLTDLNQPLLNVLIYPPPDGARPSDLAERSYMTKQAMNYLIGQLESLGYIERRAKNGRGRRLVYLTRRGWEVYETQWASMQQLEAEWAAIIGKRKMDQFMHALRQLASLAMRDASLLETTPRPRRSVR
jgi:DNA-binding MarR family transcriptional regulator